MLEREAWMLLGGITAAGALGAALPLRRPEPPKPPPQPVVTRLTAMAATWGVFIAGSFILAAFTRYTIPYALLVNLGFIAASAIHGWLGAAPFRYRRGAVRAVGPTLALLLYAFLAFGLLAVILPEAMLLQLDESGAVHDREDYGVLVFGAWPGALITTAAAAISSRRGRA